MKTQQEKERKAKKTQQDKDRKAKIINKRRRGRPRKPSRK
jgi:hypothetical protein